MFILKSASLLSRDQAAYIEDAFRRALRGRPVIFVLDPGLSLEVVADDGRAIGDGLLAIWKGTAPAPRWGFAAVPLDAEATR